MIAWLIHALQAHFAALRRAGKWKFFWWVSLEGLVVPLIVLALIELFVEVPERADMQDFAPLKLLVLAVAIAPVIETLISQAFPVMLGRRWGLGFWGQVAASIAVFAPLHGPSGWATVLCAGVFSGFYIAFTYVHWRQESFRSALWMTSGTHALHNLVLVGAIVLGQT